MVYVFTILFTGVISIVDALSQAGLNIEFLVNIFSKLPLYSQGLGWIVPAITGIILGIIASLFNKENFDRTDMAVN